PRCAAPPDSDSFPTRRSSDLLVGVDDLLERERGVVDVVGVDADSDGSALLAGDLGAARDELAHRGGVDAHVALRRVHGVGDAEADRKSTRLNSSHVKISYAVV